MAVADTSLLLDQCCITVPESRADDLMQAILMFDRTHSKANLWQLGAEREFQLQHSDEGTVVTSERRNLAHFLWYPLG